VRRYNCNILNAPDLQTAFFDFKPELVVHLAARTDLDEKENLQGYATNIQGTENLLAAVKACPSVQRVIYTSSQLVCRVGVIPKSALEYCPDTLYGESKVISEKLIVESQGVQREWLIVRPTTVWGPDMSDHYRTFLRMIKQGRYFHVGRAPLYKSYGYVGNIAHQYIKLLGAQADKAHGRTLYLADYQPIDLIKWADAIQRAFGAPRIRTIPRRAAQSSAKIGDMLNLLGWRSFPLNSFRLRNVLTQYVFDMTETERLCESLPYNLEEGVSRMVAWFESMESV
jgi:GlcNAc-P-P-Und epimerase